MFAQCEWTNAYEYQRKFKRNIPVRWKWKLIQNRPKLKRFIQLAIVSFVANVMCVCSGAHKWNCPFQGFRCWFHIDLPLMSNDKFRFCFSGANLCVCSALTQNNYAIFDTHKSYYAVAVVRSTHSSNRIDSKRTYTQTHAHTFTLALRHIPSHWARILGWYSGSLFILDDGCFLCVCACVLVISIRTCPNDPMRIYVSAYQSREIHRVSVWMGIREKKTYSKSNWNRTVCGVCPRIHQEQ